MDWDQFVFKKISDLVREIRKQKFDPIEEENRVSLDDLKPRLTYLAQLLTGTSISILPAEHTGGWKGGHFFLPAAYSRALDKQGNTDYYIFRIFYMYGQFCLEHYWKANECYSEKQAYQHSENCSGQVIAFVANEYSLFEELHSSVIRAEQNYDAKMDPKKSESAKWLYGKWFTFDQVDLNEYQKLIDPISKQTVADDKDKEKYTEVEGKHVEDTKVLQVDTKAQEEYTMTHNFEKVETLDSFSGRWRDFDGSDDMDEHEEALQELNLDQLVRVDSPVHSIYRTDFVNAMGLQAMDNSISQYHFSYPEWNDSSKSYRENYCKIIYDRHQDCHSKYVQNCIQKNEGAIKSLTKNSEKYLSDYFVKKRLSDGDEPDLDAMVDAFVDVQTGKTPSENLYLSKRKKSKDIAILVLVDSSLSTDGFTNNQRILDIEKEAIIMASEVWSKFDLRFQIDSFSSHTHSQCFYSTFKGFHEDWNQIKSRIGDMQSAGYTRIGAALRHATYLLHGVKSDHKWLLLISDGKPNDYDTYEGNYGIYDVKKAIQEASQKKIYTSAIAIDANAKFYFPKMFGLHGYTILNHPSQLCDSLTKFYINLIK
jgi:nitric oxide reductase NorD protein